MKSKICGISDLKTLEFLNNHLYPPEFIGFIVNYKKSKRYVELDKLKILLNSKKKSFYVAVLVKPDQNILNLIKNMPFDYYQIYDCKPYEIKKIKDLYNKKIISAFTVEDAKDIEQYKLYENVSDILLFDGKGYEKSVSFKHSLIKNVATSKEVMVAGDIQVDDDLENLKEIADIIDISGGLETSGFKDVLKIEIFLNKIKKLKDEN